MAEPTTTTAPPEAPGRSHRRGAVDWAIVAGLIYLILVAVGAIGTGFKSAAGDQAKELFAFANNPFLGLIVGTVATALIQSSSTVTSIIVGLVAGGMPVTVAIPMVMGANIGTTITNTIVSMGHAAEDAEFERAFSAATVHDVFNWLSVVVFLPLELAFGFLEKMAHATTGLFLGADSMSIGGLNFIKPLTKPVLGVFDAALGFLPHPFDGVAMIVLGVGLIFFSVNMIGRVLKVLMVGTAKRILHGAIGRGPVSGIASGTAVTVLVQSSSTTTSLMVPLVGSGVFTMRDIYPFTLGANIGTTITALLAATAVVGPNAGFALEIALIHFYYNIIGTVVIYGIPFLRELPPRGAEALARVAARQKLAALGYIAATFFVVPAALIFLWR